MLQFQELKIIPRLKIKKKVNGQFISVIFSVFRTDAVFQRLPFPHVPALLPFLKIFFSMQGAFCVYPRLFGRTPPSHKRATQGC